MLSISNVETFYGNIQALRGVNVKVNSGEIVSLIGSNGAGKSTLLMTISGVNKAATGEIKFDDKNIESLPPHDIVNLGISQVPEGRRIFSRLSVEDNLRLGASSNDKGKNFDNDVKDVYDLCVNSFKNKKAEVENHVKNIYKNFTDDEISNKMAEMLTSKLNNIPLKIIFQKIEGLHKACPNHKGDWYFTGNYPTPGGNRVVNKSFINFYEGKSSRAY